MYDWFRQVFGRTEDMTTQHDLPKPEPEPPTITYYRLGITNNNRVSFQMGMREITMNRAAVDNLIQQLQIFRDQLLDE